MLTINQTKACKYCLQRCGFDMLEFAAWFQEELIKAGALPVLKQVLSAGQTASNARLLRVAFSAMLKLAQNSNDDEDDDDDNDDIPDAIAMSMTLEYFGLRL